MHPTLLEVAASLLFALAILHTFAAEWIQNQSEKFPHESVRSRFLAWMGNVEAVFGVWAGLLVLFIATIYGPDRAVQYLEEVNFNEPLFVFAIMCIAATRPLITLARAAIEAIAGRIPLPHDVAYLLVCLTLGPWLGSLITEPAAMTLTALLLRERFFVRPLSTPLRYGILGTLFVNISIGGTLTHFAAPPVVMVAHTWNWDLQFMFTHFGRYGMLASLINALGLVTLFRKELNRLSGTAPRMPKAAIPWGLVLIHCWFLVGTVLGAHHPAVFLPLLALFIGFTDITRKHQDRVQLKEAALVGFFLAGLVVLGQSQGWWLAPLLAKFDPTGLFLGATGLTAITDNAALTFLGSQVPHLSDSLKHALVAGAVAGGGLTVIANAPNPAGYGILHDTFGENGISPAKLFAAALVPTGVAMLCLWFLPNF